MFDRHFQDTQPHGRDPHLHFKVPAICFFRHSELSQPVNAHGPKGRHIGVIHAIHGSHENASKPPGDDLLWRHAAGLAAAYYSRTHDEVCLILGYRPDDGWKKRRHVAAIAVKKANYVGFRRQSRHARRASAAVTALRLADDHGTRCRSLLHGIVGRAVIDHDDPVDTLRQDFSDDAGDWFGFIKTGHDDGDNFFAPWKLHRDAGLDYTPSGDRRASINRLVEGASAPAIFENSGTKPRNSCSSSRRE